MRLPSRALAALWLVPVFPVAQQPPSYPAQTERVMVDVIVSDPGGRPLPGLTREDFVVKENGAVQAIAEFEAVDLVVDAPEPAPRSAPTGVSTNATPEKPTRTFLVVFDDLHLSPASADLARKALRTFLERNVREGDRVTLAPTAGGGFWSGRASEDVPDLLAALDALKGRRPPDLSKERLSDYEAMKIEVDRDDEALQHVAQRYAALGLGPMLGAGAGASAPAESPAFGLVRSLATETYRQVRQRDEATLASLERALLALGDGRGRRSVILVSDGFIQDARLPGFARVRAAAQRANAALYFIDTRGLRGPAGAGDVEMPSLPDVDNRGRYHTVEREYAGEAASGSEGIAVDTGGFAIRGSNDLEGGLARIARESQTFYLISYEPPERRRDGRYRKIEVQVRRPGLVVRARKGYYDGAPRGSEPAAGAARPPVIDTLDDQGAIPLRLASYVLGDAAAGRATVLIAAEADPAALALAEEGGRIVGALESRLSLVARETGDAGHNERVVELALRPEARASLSQTWVPVTHRFELPAGRYQARLVLRDRRSGRVGSVRHEFDVPLLAGLRLTTPILSDTLAPASGADAPPVPVPVARRSFAAGTRLSCSVGVAGLAGREATARVSVSFEVRRADGSVVTQTAPQALRPDAAGQLGTVLTLTLNRPGGYELRLRAHDETTGEDALADQAFTVTAVPASPTP